MFIDTHSHPYTEEFDDDREAVIARAREAGAEMILLPNINEASVGPMLELCEKHPDFCRPMMGLHPTELPDTAEEVETALNHMECLLEAPNHPYIAIGEVGIDLYWDDSRRDEQIAVFKHQAQWAMRYHLPLMVHSRAAHRDLVDTLLPMKDELTGVFHCFGGTAEEARELLDTFPGFVLGIGGVLTFKKSKLPAVLRSSVPLNRIVVETDAPYLAPTPHRGQRNEPAFVPLVIEKLAEVYELPVDNVAQTLMDTTKAMFNI